MCLYSGEPHPPIPCICVNCHEQIFYSVTKARWMHNATVMTRCYEGPWETTPKATPDPTRDKWEVR